MRSLWGDGRFRLVSHLSGRGAIDPDFIVSHYAWVALQGYPIDLHLGGAAPA